jgi:Zn-dependent protease with chaperone function
MDLERRRMLKYLAAWSLGACTCGGCRTVPMTNRKQLLLTPESQEVALGLSSFEEVKTKEPASANRTYIDLVNRVGQRIAAAADRPDYKWEFCVIATDTQNAFCLPGGKVAVYEGIIPVCGNEAGLAVVMSHEISHALARHGGERMSQNYAVDGVKQAMSYVTQKQDAAKKEMLMQAYGYASQYGVILPYSRKHESEADHMGIQLMAKAGYEPSEAPRFWTRFGALQAGKKPAEFMSTHPSDDHRAKDLESWLPEANQLYAAAPNKIGTGEAIVAAPPSASPPAPAAGPGPAAPAGPAPGAASAPQQGLASGSPASGSPASGAPPAGNVLYTPFGSPGLTPQATRSAAAPTGTAPASAAQAISWPKLPFPFGSSQ